MSVWRFIKAHEWRTLGLMLWRFVEAHQGWTLSLTSLWKSVEAFQGWALGLTRLWRFIEAHQGRTLGLTRLWRFAKAYQGRTLGFTKGRPCVWRAFRDLSRLTNGGPWVWIKCCCQWKWRKEDHIYRWGVNRWTSLPRWLKFLAMALPQSS